MASGLDDFREFFALHRFVRERALHPAGENRFNSVHGWRLHLKFRIGAATSRRGGRRRRRTDGAKSRTALIALAGCLSRACTPKIPARVSPPAPESTTSVEAQEKTAPIHRDRPVRPGSSPRPAPRGGSGTSRSGRSSSPIQNCNGDAESSRLSSQEVRAGRLRALVRRSMNPLLLAMAPMFPPSHAPFFTGAGGAASAHKIL